MTASAMDDDLLCEEAIADPYAWFGRLRDHDPVHWNGRHRSWVVTDHAGVSSCFRDPRLSSDRVVPHFGGRASDDGQPWLEAVRTVLAGWMVFKDPPEHTRLRRSVSRAFTPRMVDRLEPRVDAIVDDLLALMPDGGEVDVVAELAFPLPAIVIAEMLGVPPDDREFFKSASDELGPLVFGDLAAPDRHERAGRALAGLAEYLRDLLAHYRRHPAENLMAGLGAQQGADGLSEDEVIATAVLVLFAGHETTTNLLANGLRALLQHPRSRADLLDHPELRPRAVEELLRFDGPAKLSVRWVAQDLDLAGRAVERGQRVLLVHAAANRDPTVFDRPDELVLDRADNPHLALGLGPHYCLGAPLARLEARRALPRILERHPRMTLSDAPVPWHRTMLIRGPRELRVRLDGAGDAQDGSKRRPPVRESTLDTVVDG